MQEVIYSLVTLKMFGTSDESKIRSDLMEKEIVVQSHKNIYNFLNQMMHNKRKIKECYISQLNEVMKEHKIEALHLNKREWN